MFMKMSSCVGNFKEIGIGSLNSETSKIFCIQWRLHCSFWSSTTVMSKYKAHLKSRSNGVKRGIGLTFGVKSRKVEEKKSCEGLHSPGSVFLKTFKRTVTITFELNIDDLAMQSSLTS